MDLKCAIFAGPSLSSAQYLDNCKEFSLYPPCKSGDIYRVLAMDYNSIMIVDGLFHGEPSVWHREIIAAIHNNMIVVGSSSMGALRAAELSEEGMIGIGKVYNWYKTNIIEADDEVALSHSPTTPYNALTEPLVDIRYQLEEFLNNVIIEEEAKKFQKEVIKIARSIEYWNRSPYKIDEVLMRELSNKKLAEKFIDERKEIQSIKKLDCCEAMDYLRRNILNLIQDRAANKPQNNFNLYESDHYALYAIMTREYKNTLQAEYEQILPYGYTMFRASLFNFIACTLKGRMKQKIEIECNIEPSRNIDRYESYNQYTWGLLRHELCYIESVMDEFIKCTKEEVPSEVQQAGINNSYTELEQVQSKINPFLDILEDPVCILNSYKTQVLLILETWKRNGICLKHLLNLYNAKESQIKIDSLSDISQKYILTGYFGPNILGLNEQLCCANNLKFLLYEQFIKHERDERQR